MPRSPTQKALQLLRAHGWHVEVVEHWDGFAKKRRDLLGFADLLAFNPRVSVSTLAVQVTAAGSDAARVTKLKGLANVRRALACGWRVEVWGMRKAPVNGSGLKARTFIFEDGAIRVEEGSLALEASA